LTFFLHEGSTSYGLANDIFWLAVDFSFPFPFFFSKGKRKRKVKDIHGYQRKDVVGLRLA